MKPADLFRKQKQDLLKKIDEIELKVAFQKIPSIIKERTRDEGAGVSEKDGRKRPLKKLKESTIEKRKYLERDGRLSPETTPQTSNLTESGQLLDSIKLVIKNKKKITIEPTGKRKDGSSNKEIAKYVEEGGRNFLGLTTGEKTAVDKELKSAINKAVKDSFK